MLASGVSNARMARLKITSYLTKGLARASPVLSGVGELPLSEGSGTHRR